MATYDTGIALAFGFNDANGTTGSISPSGSNRAIFGSVACVEFGGAPTIVEMRHGGSGGTLMTRLGSDLGWINTDDAEHAVFGDASGPTGSTTLYADWDLTPLQSAMGGVCYTGVDQTTPFSGLVSATPVFTAATTSVVASVTVTGCSVGQVIVASVFGLADAVNLAAFSAVAGTTIRTSDITNTYMGVAFLEKVATGSSETLEVNVNTAASSGIYWSARGVRINDVAGGSGVSIAWITA